MRIISGEMKGKRLKTFEGDAVRPTSDRVKEALFNILQFRVEGRSFLDLFAGSGQIGLEAISRGAETAVLVDAAKSSIKVIEENVATMGVANRVRVVNADSTLYIKHPPFKFDIAFLDPPYRKGLIEDCLLDVSEAMNDSGIIICEHPSDIVLPNEVGSFVKIKDYRYGKIILTTYEQGE